MSSVFHVKPWFVCVVIFSSLQSQGRCHKKLNEEQTDLNKLNWKNCWEGCAAAAPQDNDNEDDDDDERKISIN